MYLHFERNTNAKCDCTILNLTWMGKVPDEVPEEEGWKLNRTNYYQEGWLATGNIRGIVGITFTSSHCKKGMDVSPLRTNYNLRGHHSQVMMVKWNEPYQKLASCDSTGIIFVWIKYDGRWNVELINDRNTPVTNFAWSHDGKMALICYKDGFVLVGSVAGQRYWSSMLNITSTVTCGVWTPDDQQVYFGTSAGQIIVMDVTGAMVSQVQVPVSNPHHAVGITSMAWSCEKFKMDEVDDNDHSNTHPDGRLFVMAVCLESGTILLMKHYDDLSPVIIYTGLAGPLSMEWSNSGELLAVAGYESGPPHPPPPSPLQSQPLHSVPTPMHNIYLPSHQFEQAQQAQQQGYANVLKCYSDSGVLLYCVNIPYTKWPVTALTWGHNDKRLFIATGAQVHIAWVSRRIPSLHLLCRLAIYRQMKTDGIGGSSETQLARLPIPHRLQQLISALFSQTIRCCVPETCALRDFVSRPPKGNVRLHCTMIRHGDDNLATTGTCYTLYLEYLGGLVPLLKGKRTSKIRPEFVIFDPQHDINSSVDARASLDPHQCWNYREEEVVDSDSDREEGCASPRLGRRKGHQSDRRSRLASRPQPRLYGVPVPALSQTIACWDLEYRDTLPEDVQLVLVTSNIWGTKFKIHGLLDGSMPSNLGQIVYKTSLLHLQPRQMTLCMTEMREDYSLSANQDANFNPHVFSEDEDDSGAGAAGGQAQGQEKHRDPASTPTQTPRVARKSSSAPGGDRSGERDRRRSDARDASTGTRSPGVPALARAESYTDDDFPTGPAPFQRSGPCSGALQSPKNAVAPLVSAPPATSDYSGNVHRVKSSLAPQSDCTQQHYQFQPEPEEQAAAQNLLEPSSGASPGACSSACGDQSGGLKFAAVTLRSIEFIDEEVGEVRIGPVRSCSVGFLDQAAGGIGGHIAAKRLVLTTRRPRQLPIAENSSAQSNESKVQSRQCSKSKSLDVFPGLMTCALEASKLLNRSPCFEENDDQELVTTDLTDESAGPSLSAPTVDVARHPSTSTLSSACTISSGYSSVATTSTLSSYTGPSSSSAVYSMATPPSPSLSLSPSEASSTARLLPHSTPTSPMPSKKSSKRTLSSSPIRQRILNSPLLPRRIRRNKNTTESTDDEEVPSGDESSSLLGRNAGRHYRNLESFQKAQLRQKLKDKKSKSDSSNSANSPNGRHCGTSSQNPHASTSNAKPIEFVMHNKPPSWNENSQVYQLDFGGRVTQESAKNFQIEFLNKQVLQFGRIDGNAYTLDFQYPFSALQAFAVALANITQRLK